MFIIYSLLSSNTSQIFLNPFVIYVFYYDLKMGLSSPCAYFMTGANLLIYDMNSLQQDAYYKAQRKIQPAWREK